MEPISPLNFTRKFFGDKATDIEDFELIESYARNKDISGDTPIDQIIAQMEESAFSKLQGQNAESNIKTTRQLFGEGALGIDDNTLAVSFAKANGLSMDTPLADVFQQMEQRAEAKIGQSDISAGGDTIPLDRLPGAIEFLRSQDEDGRSGFNFGLPDVELDLEGVSDYLRPEETRPNFFERLGQEVLSLDFFTNEGARELARGAATLQSDNEVRQRSFNEIDRQLNNPDAIASFVSKAERFQQNPELFSEEERKKLFQAAKLFETTNVSFRDESSGLAGFMKELPKTVAHPIATGISQMLGTAFEAADIDQDFTDSVLRDLNFNDEVLAATDPESAAVIAGQVAGSVAQTVVSIMSGMGPAGMFALYGTQGAGGNIETYRALARNQGFDPDLGEQAMVGLGGMVIAGGLGAALTGKTIGQLPFVKSFQEGGEKAIFEAANRAGIFQNVTRDRLFSSGLQALTAVMKNPQTVKEAAKAYGRFAVSTGTVEGLQEGTEEALNELLFNATVEKYEFEPEQFIKDLGFSIGAGFLSGGAIGPAVRSRIRKETKNISANLLGLQDIAPTSIEEASANLSILQAREEALNRQFKGNIPSIIQDDINETRAKLQSVANGIAAPEEVFDISSRTGAERFISPLGDIAADSRLKGTGFQEAAEASLSSEAAEISDSQLEAFRELDNRLRNSDLPTDVANRILGRVRLTRMETGRNRRNAVTMHDVDDEGQKSLHRVLFTNASNKKSAYDELFHILVDPVAPETQAQIVSGFNQTYNATAKSYDSERTRDRIAAKVASIINDEEDLPEIDNPFTRLVRNIQEGEFLAINPDLVGGAVLRETEDGPTRSVALDELNRGLNDGTYRMVSAPGFEGRTTFQDQDGFVYEYFTSEDSDGNASGNVKMLTRMEQLETIGVPVERVPTVRSAQGTITPGGGIAENLNQERKETFKRVQERLRKRNLRRVEGITNRPVAEGESLVTLGSIIQDPADERDLLSANILRRLQLDQDIPLQLVQRLEELAGQPEPRLLTEGPASLDGQTRLAEGQSVLVEGQGQTFSTRDPAQTQVAPFDPTIGRFEDTRVAPRPSGFNIDDRQGTPEGLAVGPSRGPQSVQEGISRGEVIDRASEIIRRLEAAGEPVPQALLDLITVEAEISEGDPAPPPQLTGRPIQQQLPPTPVTFSDFLAATEQTPDQFAQQTRDRLLEQQREQSVAALIPQDNEPLTDEPVASSVDDPVLSQLDPEIAQSVNPGLTPAIEAMITGNEIEGMVNTGEIDPRTGFSLMETTEESADQLIAAGVAAPGKVDIGGTITDTLPTVISINPDALLEVAQARQEQTPEVQIGFQEGVALETFSQEVLPTLDLSSSIEYIEAEDETGEVTRYITKQSLINELESNYSETSDNPGPGSIDIITAGPREFQVRRRREDLIDVLQDGMGVKAEQVGAVMAVLPDGTNKTKLVKATKRVARQLVRQAQGSGRFNPETLAKNLRQLDETLAEINPGIDLTQFTRVVGIEGLADVDTEEGVSEVQAALEATEQTEPETQVNEPPIDLSDKDVKANVRRMRQRKRRSNFNRLGIDGTAEFRTNRQKNADSFIGKAEELGATDVTQSKVTDPETGKDEFVVSVKFHPEVANEIFQDQVQSLSNDPLAVFSNPRTVNDEKTVSDPTAIIEPNFSEGVPGPLRAATSDNVKGLKLRANVYVATSSDLINVVIEKDASDIHSVLMRKARKHAEINALRESEGLGGHISELDSNGRTHSVIYIDDRNVDLDSKLALETLSHEIGHVVEFDILNRSEHDQGYQELSQAHEQFVQESMDKTLFEFLTDQRLPESITSGIDMDYARNITLRQMKNDPKMIQQFKYITGFDEWFADQTARWIVSEKKPEVTKATGGIFKAIEKRFRSLFNRFFKRGAFPPNKTFDNWMNEHVTMSREAENNFFNGNYSIERGRNIDQEDSMPLALINPGASPQEVNFREENQFEKSVNGELVSLRDEIPNWLTLEQAVRNGKSAADTMPTQELVRKARHYEDLYAASIALANRPAPLDVPLDTYASYSTSAGPFGERFTQRMENYWQMYRESTFNQVRRQLLSPVITRMQIVTGNHPEINALRRLQDATFASAGSRAGDVPYVDKVNQEIILRTGRVTAAVRPIFEAFGYTNTGVQRATVGLFRGGKLDDISKQLFRGIRDRSLLTSEQLNTEYNGVKLNTIIDNLITEMDSLRDFAQETGLISEDEFITYEDSNGQEHYVPRIYETETVQANFAHFKTHIIERNLRRVHRKESYLEFLAETDPTRIQGLSEQELDDIEVPSTFVIEDPDGQIEKMIVDSSEQIAANIAYGRTTTFAKQFNPFSGHKDYSKILDDFGTIVPDRMKQRKLFFVPDQELFGEVEVAGKKINYLETNIVNVLGKSIDQIVKRGEYNRIYNRGEVFKNAYDQLKAKQREAEGNGDTRLSNSIQFDLETIEALYESVAEVVDMDTHKTVQHGPVRGLLASLSRISTMSVMGLSSILAIVELGNVPLRVGLVPGARAVFGRGLELGFKKLVNWPGAALGGNKNYTSKMERELEMMGYLHIVGEDFSARVRMDNPFDHDNNGAFSLNRNQEGRSIGEGKAFQVGRNLTTAIEYLEDVFYKATMLEGITRVTQVVAAHAADDLIHDIIETSDSGDLNSAQIRELERLGFVSAEGKFDKEAFDDYKNFHKGLQRARLQGRDAIEAYVEQNRDMFQGAHFRTTSRLITQMIARPNVVTRPKWGNSKNPIKRMMYRLRSFTYGYREMAFRFYSDEFKNVAGEEGAWGIARMLSRLLPLLFFAGLSIVVRAELQAGIHEAMGNTEQAKRIRTLQENKTAMDFMVEAFDKSGFTLQGSEGIGAVTGLKYGNSIFSTIGGVGASKIEALAEKSMKTYQTGDPSFLWNEMVELAPGANVGVWDGIQISPQKSDKQYKSDADYFGMLNGSSASWY